MSLISQNTENQSEEKMAFHLIYYVMCSKKIETRVLPKDSGYAIMCKRANAMPSNHMAMAVHPLDVKTLIPEMCQDMTWKGIAERMQNAH